MLLIGLMMAIVAWYSTFQLGEKIECTRKLESTLAQPMYLRVKKSIDSLFFEEFSANVTDNCIDMLKRNLSSTEIENLKATLYNESLVIPPFHRACQLEWAHMYISGMMTPSKCSLEALAEAERAVGKELIIFHKMTRHWNNFQYKNNICCHQFCDQQHNSSFLDYYYCRESRTIYAQYERFIKRNY